MCGVRAQLTIEITRLSPSSLVEPGAFVRKYLQKFTNKSGIKHLQILFAFLINNQLSGRLLTLNK